MKRTKNRKDRRYIKEWTSIHKGIVLKLLERKTATQIAKELKKAKSTISEHIKNLEFSGFIEEELHSVIKYYVLTKKGKEYYSAFIKGYDMKPDWHLRDRAHNIKVIAKIIRDIPNKELVEWKQKPMKNWIKFYKDFAGVGVIKTTQSIVIQIPKCYYRNAKEAIAQAGILANETCNMLEKEYKGLKIDRYFEISHQSHALVGDPVAQLANQNKVVLQGGRVELDCSEFPEIEFTDKRYGADDFENYLHFIEPVLQGKITPEVINNHNVLVLRDEIVKLKKQVQR